MWVASLILSHTTKAIRTPRFRASPEFTPFGVNGRSTGEPCTDIELNVEENKVTRRNQARGEGTIVDFDTWDQGDRDTRARQTEEV